MAEQRIEVAQEIREQSIDVLSAGAEQNIEIGSEPSVLHGIDGVSPIATVTQTETGATISITDRDGTTTAIITNGKDGAQGERGEQGIQGEKGEKGDRGETGATGATGATGPKGDTGATGAAGKDGYSPTATVTKSGDTATIKITDKNGTTSAQIKDGTGASITVDSAMSSTSTNPVQNKAITNALHDKADASIVPTKTSQLTNDSNFATTSQIPTKTSDLTNDGSDGSAEYLETDETAYATASIPYGKVDSTSTATAFTATVPGITQLRQGVSFWLENGVVTSASGFTVNINGLGAKPVYNNMAAATRDTTIFNAAYTMLFVYDEDRVSGGAFICYRGYDANTNTIGYQLRTNSQTMPMTSITYRYRLLFTSADGEHYVPANNSSSTNATASRTVCQDPIDPFGPIFYYGTTASVAAGARPAAASLWQQYVLTLGYSFNRTGAALTLTSYKPVYVKAAPQSDGSAIIDSTTPYVQDLPATEDGKIYIFLGVAYSATNIELELDHPVYYYKDGAIRLWTNPAAQSITIDSALSSTSTNPVQNSVITAAIGDVESILATLNNGGGAQ